MASNRPKAPWPDYRGVDIFEGDTIVIAYRVGNFRPWPWEVIHG